MFAIRPGISTILLNTNAQARTMCGTPYYFSPELCQNKPVWIACSFVHVAPMHCTTQGVGFGRGPSDAPQYHSLHQVVLVFFPPFRHNTRKGLCFFISPLHFVTRSEPAKVLHEVSLSATELERDLHADD